MSIVSGQIMWNTGTNCDHTFTLLTGIINCYHFKSRLSKLRCSKMQRKYIKQGKEVRKNQTAAENFDIYICLIFGHYYHQRFFFF